MRAGPRSRLSEALASLDQRERLVLSLARLDGLGTAEIARVLGGSAADAARELVLAERKLARRVRVRMVAASAAGGTRAPVGRAGVLCAHAALAHDERTPWRA